MGKSIYQTEQDSRAQGFYFAVIVINPRWPQLGHVLWSTLGEAQDEIKNSTMDAMGYKIYKNLLVEPFTCEEVVS